MAPTPQAGLLGRRREGTQGLDAEQAQAIDQVPRPEAQVLEVVAQGQDLEDVAFDVGVAGHEGPPESELVGRRDDAAQGVGRPDDDRGLGVGGPEPAAVVGGEGHGHVGAQHASEKVGRPHRRGG